MTELSIQMQRLAEIAWQNGLRGRSLEKSSLLFPLDDVLQKLSRIGGAADVETLKAASVQDIFDHLSRIADERYKPGRKKWDAVKLFVDGWFCDVLAVYGGNHRKLLNDEKLLRSAFHFYVREQIIAKAAKAPEDMPLDELPIEDEATEEA